VGEPVNASHLGGFGTARPGNNRRKFELGKHLCEELHGKGKKKGESVGESGKKGLGPAP